MRYRRCSAILAAASFATLALAVAPLPASAAVHDLPQSSSPADDLETIPYKVTINIENNTTRAWKLGMVDALVGIPKGGLSKDWVPASWIDAPRASVGPGESATMLLQDSKTIFGHAHVEYEIADTGYKFGFKVWWDGNPNNWEAGIAPRPDQFKHGCSSHYVPYAPPYTSKWAVMTLNCEVVDGTPAG